jgi:hypothetical protein
MGISGPIIATWICLKENKHERFKRCSGDIKRYSFHSGFTSGTDKNITLN